MGASCSRSETTEECSASRLRHSFKVAAVAQLCEKECLGIADSSLLDIFALPAHRLDERAGQSLLAKTALLYDTDARIDPDVAIRQWMTEVAVANAVP